MRLVVLFLFTMFVLESAMDISQTDVKVPDCDRHCSQPFALKMCCSGDGNLWDGYCHHGTAFCYKRKIPTTETPTIEMSTTKPELSNEKVIRDLRAEISRLKSKEESCQSHVEQFQEKLNVCKSDHKKYVESMARTKAIIENILASKNGQ